jgi:hypothetical protein
VNLFFLLLRHKFSSIALATFVNFNAEKRKKNPLKIGKATCIEYIFAFLKIKFEKIPIHIYIAYFSLSIFTEKRSRFFAEIFR